MKKKIMLILGMIVLVVLCVSPEVFSHCEIPCGIYNDAMRLDMMAEDIQTVEKSMNEIKKIEESGGKDYNQLVRWVINKEEHSDKLSDVVTQYFMKQRIKPAKKADGKAYEEYVNKLTLLHKMMVYSMKCKQTVDLDNVTKLRETLAEFRTAYMGEEKPSMSQHEH